MYYRNTTVVTLYVMATTVVTPYVTDTTVVTLLYVYYGYYCSYTLSETFIMQVDSCLMSVFGPYGNEQGEICSDRKIFILLG